MLSNEKQWHITSRLRTKCLTTLRLQPCLGFFGDPGMHALKNIDILIEGNSRKDFNSVSEMYSGLMYLLMAENH